MAILSPLAVKTIFFSVSPLLQDMAVPAIGYVERMIYGCCRAYVLAACRIGTAFLYSPFAFFFNSYSSHIPFNVS
jgi:hypothetical protein